MENRLSNKYYLNQRISDLRWEFIKTAHKYIGAMEIYELIDIQENLSLKNKADNVVKKLWDEYQRVANKLEDAKKELQELE